MDPTAASPSPPVRLLTPSEVREALLASRIDDSGCYEAGHSPRGEIHITIGTDGHPTNVDVLGPVNPQETACIISRVSNLRLPAQSDGLRAIVWWYPLRHSLALVRQEVVDGMRRIAPLVDDCAEFTKGRETVVVSFTIEQSGHTTHVAALGKHAGTATGDCVERAVSTAVFPSHYAPPMQMQYPLLVH
jgi:hypothetical protein